MPTERQVSIRNKYGSPAQFMARFSPVIQRKLREFDIDYVEASRYEYPILRELKEAYGTEVIHTWLCVMVEDLNEFSGVAKKMTNDQKEEIAHILMCECLLMNIAEVALFFDKIKRGIFGEYYGVLDTVRTMKILRSFQSERRSALNRQIDIDDKARQARERMKWQEDAMSADELKKAIESGRFKNLKLIFGK